MITDAVMSWFFGSLGLLVDLLPNVESFDGSSSFTTLLKWLMTFNYFLPITEVIAFFPILIGIFTGLIVFRIIRFFLPGG